MLMEYLKDRCYWYKGRITREFVPYPVGMGEPGYSPDMFYLSNSASVSPAFPNHECKLYILFIP